MQRELDANPGRRGARAFTAELNKRAPRASTRSTLEDEFLALCRSHGIEEPEANVPIDGYEVDFLWRAAKVVVEVDSMRYHHTLTAFHDDRAKANALTAACYRVFRFTDRQIQLEPETVASRLRTAT